MIKKAMKGVPVEPDFDIDRIVKQTEMYSGADIEELCDRAKDEPLLKAIATDSVVLISNKDFDMVLEKFPPSVTEKEIQEFENYNKDLKSLSKKSKTDKK